VFKTILLATLSLCLAPLLRGQERIERIEVEGNVRVPRETVLYYLFMKEGSIFDRKLLNENFKALWSTGFFSDIKIEEMQAGKGKIVRVSVEENPLLQRIGFKTGKKISQDDIIDKLKEKNEYPRTFSFFNPSKIQRIKEIIKELLLEKGFEQGEVEVDLKKREENIIYVVFQIKEGPQFKVGDVVFSRNPKLSSRVLRSAMKENKKHGLVSYIKGEDIFKSISIEKDLRSVRNQLQEHGYLNASIGQPSVEEFTKRNIFLKKEVMKRILIPVDAGFVYSVGKAKIEGNKVISKEILERLINFKKGEIYSTRNRDKIVEEMERIYREKGYLYARVTALEELDPARKSVNVTFSVDEGEMTYLQKLEIRGNTVTIDKVIRREMLVKEGERFNFSLFKDSLFWIQRLGIAGLQKEPEITSNPQEDNQIEARLYIKELQKGYFHYSGGYNDYRGGYLGLDYGAVDLLGAGERIGFKFDYGDRVKGCLFDFTDPYFLDLPLATDFDLYYRDINFYHLTYIRQGTGADFRVDARLQRFWRASLGCSFERVNVKTPEYVAEGAIDPFYFSTFGLGQSEMNSLDAELSFSTVDNPYLPAKGISFSFSNKLAGSFLGGDVHLAKPHFECSFFLPLWGKHVFGFHSEYQSIKALKGSSAPFWERFYLGGKESIRGYHSFSVGPRSEQGTNIGGEKSIVFNAEYVFPVVKPLYGVFFFDTGNAYLSSQEISFRNMYSSTGLEMRVSLSFLPAPLRLIFAFNNRKTREDSHFAVLIAVGTTF
jgi:outer membrane protein insertion porin family